MSEIIKHIKATQTDIRGLKPVTPNWFKAEQEFQEVDRIATQYSIGVGLYQKVLIGNEEKKYIPQILERVRADFAEQIFGEFRAELLELRKFGYELGYEESQKLYAIVKKIEDKMFLDGVK